MEFLAVEPDPVAVCARINSYPKKPCDKFMLNTFHTELSQPTLRAQYQALGYEFVETAMIMELPLPVKTSRGWTHVHKIAAPEEIEFANHGLSLGGEHIPPKTFGDPHIINFYAQLEHRAVGWAQLITVCEGVGYLNQLYTLPVYRQRGVGTRLLRRAHQEANHLGLNHMLLLASEMGMQLYRRAGYRPVAYLSVFQPVKQPS
jgi:GNAT superfamily N-acetyltransferase